MKDIIGAVTFSFLFACSRPSVPAPPPTSEASPRRTTVFDVRDFGAKGDGVTDDAPAILAAIAAKDAARGGEVFFPAGNYMCHSPVDFGTTGGVIRGAGWASNNMGVPAANKGTFLYSNLAKGYAFTVGETERATVLFGIQIKDMAFVSSLSRGGSTPARTAATGLAIRPTQLQAIVGVTVQNVLINGFAVGLNPGCAESCTFNNISVQYNDTGVLIDGSAVSRTFQNNWFQNLNAQENQIGLDMAVGINVSFFGGILQANKRIGARFRPLNPGGKGAGHIAEVAMHGTWFEGNNGTVNAYQVTATGTTPPAVTITGTPPGGVPGSIEIDITRSGPLGTAQFRWKLNGATQQENRSTASTFPLGSTGMTAAFPSGAYATDDVYAGTGLGDIVVDVSNETTSNAMQLLDVAFHNCHSSDGGPLQFIRNTPQNQSTYADVKFYDSTFIGVTLPLPNWAHSCVVLGSVFAAITDAGVASSRTNIILGSGNFPAEGQELSQLSPAVAPGPNGREGRSSPIVRALLDTSAAHAATIYTSPPIAGGQTMTIEARVTSTDTLTSEGYSAKIAGTFYNAYGSVREQGAPTTIYNHGNLAGLKFAVSGTVVSLQVTPNSSHPTHHRCDVSLGDN